MGDEQKIIDKYLKLIDEMQTGADLEDLRVEILGKKGKLTSMIKSLSTLDIDQRKSAGKILNELRKKIEQSIISKKQLLNEQELNIKIQQGKIDVTLPHRQQYKGSIHAIIQAQNELISILTNMGFLIVDGADIEDNFHNFTALNIAENHPARQEHDTFYVDSGENLDENLLLRTHTSPVQVRTMMNSSPPLQIASVGRVYRNDYDATHTPTFHQIEGLLIDKNIHMGHLKHCIQQLLQQFFAIPNLKLRFCPSYFPFTEPSAEVDIAYKKKQGKKILGNSGKWLEVLGCGMVNNKVLENCNIDSNKYQGFAFGIGIERMAMLKYNIPDLRYLYSSDVRLLQHYGFSPF